MLKNLILAIDQGTSSTKSLIFTPEGEVLSRGSVSLRSYYPQPGFVEQDPDEIYRNVLESVDLCLKDFRSRGGDVALIRTCGISNQRETMVLWDEQGAPLHKAVVWQCKRSVNICERLKTEGIEPELHRKTGLIVDPYFSGTKVMWLNENDHAIKKAIHSGKAFFGTIDTWLLYKLTKGREFRTDYTNASRTLFFGLGKLEWDPELLREFGLDQLNLPQPCSSSSYFGDTDFEGLLDQVIPITGMIGDSHAAAFGEGCYQPGTAKATLGTGSSILWNTGSEPVFSNVGMMSTICWSTQDRVDYALEGIIVTCGATIEWLKDKLGLFADSMETEKIALSLKDNQGVYLVPAFSGLGAPHWKMGARAMITGLTFGSTKDHIIRAALESVPYQIKDVIAAMEKESRIKLKELKVDGGISANRFVVQFLSDLLDTRIVNIGMTDVSALGAALIAGIGAGMIPSVADIKLKKADELVYMPDSRREMALKGYQGWKEAVKRL